MVAIAEAVVTTVEVAVDAEVVPQVEVVPPRMNGIPLPSLVD